MKKILVVVSVCCLLSTASGLAKANVILANETSIAGFVRDSKTKETLVSATVMLQGTKHGSRTNKNGYFSISEIPPGDYTLVATFLGYEKAEVKISLKANQNVRKDIELLQSSVKSDEIVVEAEREIEKRQITISKVNVPIETIKEIRVGGESDIFRSLQFLPGVLTSSQISSGLFVRGGSPDQNLVMLDGSTVYNPTHLFGFISTFNTEAIKDVELVKGGFDPQFGGRLSAVLNITQKDGDRSGLGGSASLGAISSRASLEGPIGNGAWFIGGRRTYFEIIKKFLSESPESPIPDFNFYDVNAKITQDIDDNNKISVSSFLSSDKMEFSSIGMDMGLEIGNKLASLKWTHIFSNKLFATTNLSASQYTNNFIGDQSGYKFLMENSITDYTGKLAFEWFTNDKITHKFGIEVNNYNFRYLQNFTGDTDSTQVGSSAGTTNLKVKDYNYAAYAQVNYAPIELLSFQAGIRANYWDLKEKLLIDPRLAARYQITENMAIKAAWGIFSQNLRLATQPDFSFFDTWLPTDSSVAASRATHYILSLETSPHPHYNLNFDAYYKKFDNVSELNTNAMQGSKVADLFYIGNAYAYGVEAFIQKKVGKLTGWAGYAIGFIKAQFDSINMGKTFRPKYDRLHDFKVVAQYSLNENWDFGATFTFQSGQSFTGATSRFQSTLPHQNFGRAKIIPSQRYGLRLPPSHQLNINVSYNFKSWELDSKLILDIYNVYNRRDIWVRFYNVSESQTTVDDVRLIPILPTISYEIKF